jgi:hypothetical protein
VLRATYKPSRTSYVVRSTKHVLLPPPRSLRVRYTRRIDFRRNARWGRAGVTGTPRVATPGHSARASVISHGLAGRINYRKSTGRLARFEALPDPALRCGENSRPGKVRHRLEDSREAILWFHHTRLSSVSGLCFGGSVANKPNRVAKFLALASDGFGCFRLRTPFGSPSEWQSM